MQTAAETLQMLAADPQYVGGTLGIPAVLHTWTRALLYHRHVHCLVPGGGLAVDGTTWKRARGSFPVPVRAVSVRFRARFLARLRTAFPEVIVPPAVWAKPWVVYAKPTVQGSGLVLRYLVRYVLPAPVSAACVTARLPQSALLWVLAPPRRADPRATATPARASAGPRAPDGRRRATPQRHTAAAVHAVRKWSAPHHRSVRPITHHRPHRDAAVTVVVLGRGIPRTMRRLRLARQHWRRRRVARRPDLSSTTTARTSRHRRAPMPPHQLTPWAFAPMILRNATSRALGALQTP